MTTRILALAALCLCAPAGAADIGSVTRLTNIRNSYPSPSPDGEHIVFQSNRSGTNQLYLINADGGGLQPLTDEARGAETPAWSPDGARIVYSAYVGDNNNDVFVINSDGSGRQQFTTGPGYDGHPHWSFDGRRIVFNSDRTSPDPDAEWSQRWHEIFSMRIDGSDVRQHTQCRSVCTYGSMSPDNRRIVYRKTTDSPGFSWTLKLGTRNSEVFLADADGGNEVNLTDSAAFDGWPLWSPAGTHVVFASNRDGPAGVGHLFTVAVDGGALHKVTAGAWSYVQPAWSSDGKRLYAYQNQETDDYEFGDVVVIDLED